MSKQIRASVDEGSIDRPYT